MLVSVCWCARARASDTHCELQCPGVPADRSYLRGELHCASVDADRRHRDDDNTGDNTDDKLPCRLNADAGNPGQKPTLPEHQMRTVHTDPCHQNQVRYDIRHALRTAFPNVDTDRSVK